MNAASAMAAPHPLIGEALSALADIGRRGGHPDWTPPAVAMAGAQIDRLVEQNGLGRGEALVVALLATIECDAAVARRVAEMQHPVGGARLLAGLAVAIAVTGASDPALTVASLFGGRASAAGLILWGEESAPLPERSIFMPVWIAATMAGASAMPPGITAARAPKVLLPEAVRADAERLAGALNESGPPPLVLIRAACPEEGQALAQMACAAAGLMPVMCADPAVPGLSAWLQLTGSVSLIVRESGPGETIDLTGFDAIGSPMLAIIGMQGQARSARPLVELHAVVPDEAARAELWRGWGFGAAIAQEAAARYRQSAGRIAELGRALPDGFDTGSLDPLRAVMRGSSGRIDALARRSNARVRREDIVLPPSLAAALDRLRDRILLRNRLHDGLGPTISARYLPGVRALLTGDSGTGKTLAAHWLAEEAGLPLYRVDLSALTSKWIGETEKNLSQLLDAAEQGDVLLFFDEADALFGARTDVSDAHDRHANAQTNFLLQRIEDYAGVALLATNSRDRFDPAFVRRLDMVLDFPLPDAAARRLLWDRHLGGGHAIGSARLDHVAAIVDLAGGHVRNIVLAATARAKAQGRALDAADLDAATAEEYAKLGRTVPPL